MSDQPEAPAKSREQMLFANVAAIIRAALHPGSNAHYVAECLTILDGLAEGKKDADVIAIDQN